MNSKSKARLLFVYNHKYENIWRDGLWAALNILKEDYDIKFHNLHNASPLGLTGDYDFVLGWGAFNSPVDIFLRRYAETWPESKTKYGLCVGGVAYPNNYIGFYNILFYETEWYRPQISNHPRIMHAFGINTKIYTPWPEAPIIWDWLSVGAFAYWKRHERIIAKPGSKLVVGEIQKDNWSESFDIISDLLLAGVGISDMMYPTKLRNIYNCAGTVYIPADVTGGGERAVLEARACGRPVEIEDDNPKLRELLNSPVWDENYYASQLRKGVEMCL